MRKMAIYKCEVDISTSLVKPTDSLKKYLTDSTLPWLVTYVQPHCAFLIRRAIERPREYS